MRVVSYVILIVVYACYSLGASPTTSTDETRIGAAIERWHDFYRTRAVDALSLYTPEDLCYGAGNIPHDLEPMRRNYREIMAFGLGAVPCEIRLMSRPRPHSVDEILYIPFRDSLKLQLTIRTETTKGGLGIQWFEEYADVIGVGGNATNDIYLRWWREKRPYVSEEFEDLIKSYRAQQRGRSSPDATNYLKRIRALGVVILPDLVSHVVAGETDLVDLISELTDGSVPKTATIRDVANWWKTHEPEWTVPMPCAPGKGR